MHTQACWLMQARRDLIESLEASSGTARASQVSDPVRRAAAYVEMLAGCAVEVCLAPGSVEARN